MDGKEVEKISDQKQTRCLLENISVKPNSVLAVETLAEGGRASEQNQVFVLEEDIPSLEDEEAIRAWSDRELHSEARSPDRVRLEQKSLAIQKLSSRNEIDARIKIFALFRFLLT